MHAICWADRGVQQFHPRHCCSDTSDSAAALPWTSPVTSETAVVLAQTWRWCYLRCDGRYDALDVARSLKQPQQQMLWCHLSPYGGPYSKSVTSDIAMSPQVLLQPWRWRYLRCCHIIWCLHSLAIRDVV